MARLYFILVAVHIVSLIGTGMLWVAYDLGYQTKLRPFLRDIQAVHFGSLYLVPWLLALWLAFDKLRVPDRHQIVFPLGLGGLVFFTGIAYLLPREPGLDSFYYWTKGKPMVLSMIGLACLIVALLWTAAILVLYACAG